MSYEINNNENFSIQTGTIPKGITSSYSKYAINTSNSNSDQDISFLYTPINIYENEIAIVNDLTNSIKSGNIIQLRRYNYKQIYEISKSYFTSDGYTHLLLDSTVYSTDTLIDFVSTFPTPLSNVFMCVGLNNEFGISKSYIESFDIKMRYHNNDSFNLYLSWTLSHDAAIAKFRWRIVPSPETPNSDWIYENATYKGENTRTLTSFEYNHQYEIEILSANNDYFKDKIYYSNNVKFQFTK